MYLRCPKCLGTACLRADLDQAEANCPRCGASLALGRACELGASGRERVERAESFASEEGIDLASAYSVLLGLLELEKARTLAAVQVPPPEPPRAARRSSAPGPGPASGGAPRKRSAGRERPRGDRVPRAKQGARSPDEKGLALDWAAILERPAPAPPSKRTVYLPLIVVIVAALLLFAAIEVKRSTVALGKEPLVAPPSTRSRRGSMTPAAATRAEIERDPNGRPVRVTAGTPGEVLRAFCSAEPERLRMPVEVRPSTLGLTGVFHEDGNAYAIEIREDAGSGRWYSGDARTPLEGRRAESP